MMQFFRPLTGLLAHRAGRSESKLRPSPAMQLASVAALLLVVGCAKNLYHAHKLPPEFMAPPVDNPHVVDLSALASVGTSNNVVERGDVVELSIASGFDDQRFGSRRIRIADDGTVTVPLVGPVSIAGMELPAAEKLIAATAIERGVYIKPTVTLTLAAHRMNRVTVVGAVVKPGVIELRRGNSGLLNALVAAGGLSPRAGTEVEIRRPGIMTSNGLASAGPLNAVTPASFNSEEIPATDGSSMRINLIDAAAEGTGGIQLSDGDVVMVSKRDPQPIQVIGLVKKPGQYELPVNQELRVLDALAIAGGWTSSVADKVHVIRKIPGHPEPIVIRVSIREAKLHGAGNQRLMAGDIVSVEQTPATAILTALERVVRFSVAGRTQVF